MSFSVPGIGYQQHRPGPDLFCLTAGSTLGVMVGLDGALTLFINDEEYPADVRLPSDNRHYILADIYGTAKQLTILESPQGK